MNKTCDSGHPCLTPWVIALESPEIPFPALSLIMLSFYTTKDAKTFTAVCKLDTAELVCQFNLLAPELFFYSS